jgi:DNA-binding winged helix-turn-helix (wHTH) protein/TolB-like protein/Flp pilus assembly protein TadD
LEPASPSPASGSQVRYAFGRFVLDPAEWRLLRDRTPIKVPTKALELLLALVKRRGKLVSKAELLAEVWPGLFVEEGNITVNMSLLRRALADESAPDGHIETVPRHGYRFSAEVTILAAEDRSVVATPAESLTATPPAEPAGEGRPARRSWLQVGLASLLVLATLGAVSFALATNGDIQSVVVLPFTSLTPDPDRAYLQVGMAEALTSRLGRLGALHVSPVAAALPSEDAIGVGRRLGVDAVITGTVQQERDRLRVSVQLTSPGNQRIIWTEQFNESAADIFVVQDRIAERIATSLVRGISRTERKALSRKETSSSEAYDYYLRAREQWRLRTPEAVRAAILLYNRAIEIDSGFAMAYVGLADAYNITRSGLPNAVRYPLAKAAAERALRLDDGLAQAQTSRAFQHYKFEWQWEQAEARFRRAIQIDSTYALAHHWYGECLYLLGRFPEAIAEYGRALALDPTSTALHFDLARSQLRAGDADAALTTTERGLSLNSGDPRLLLLQSDVLAALDKPRESAETRWRAMVLEGRPVKDVDASRAAFERGGLAAMNTAEIARLLPRAERGQLQSATLLAQAYGRVNDTTSTLAWLDRAIDMREDAAIQLRSHPSFRFLEAHPRFVALQAKVNFPR